jgi:pantoate kinase
MTEATAFVPGHVTAFFTVDRDEEGDPTKTGSRGAGLAIEDGVEVTVTDAADRQVWLDGEAVEMGAVERVLDTLDADVAVHAESDVPLGRGFGVSGAMALGTAMATNAVLQRDLSTNELVTVAHGAEVQAGTGLGDVVGQALGGLPLRIHPGGPQHNYVDAVPARPRIEYTTIGELSTEDVIGGETDKLTQAGAQALSTVVSEPRPEKVVYAGRRFAREAGLLTERVRQTIRDVTTGGGEASMAMLGETVFALDSGLSDAGYDAERTRVDPAGARLR